MLMTPTDTCMNMRGLGLMRPALSPDQLAITPNDPFYVLYDPAFPPDYLFTYSGVKTADNPDGLYQSTNDELARMRAFSTRQQQGFQSLPNDSDVYQDWVRTVEADHSKYTNATYRDSFARSWLSQGATTAQIDNAFTYAPTFTKNPTVATNPTVLVDSHAEVFVKSPGIKTPDHVITAKPPGGGAGALAILSILAALIGMS